MPAEDTFKIIHDLMSLATSRLLPRAQYSCGIFLEKLRYRNSELPNKQKVAVLSCAKFSECCGKVAAYFIKSCGEFRSNLVVACACSVL